MQQTTHTTPDQGSTPPGRFAWHLAMWTIRPAAAGMAAWSLYAVARHYGVPWGLALGASLVFDGIAMGCLYQASEAVRAGRSAAAPIIATLAMVSTSVYLNLVHARLIHGGRPAEVLFATPILGLLALSALAWTTDRATAREARGETPMRLPAYGILGWVLARDKAMTALKAKALEHVTSSASATPQTASPRTRTARAVLSERFAAMDPADAIEIAADSHPQLDAAGIAQLLAAYGVTVDPLEVALVLGQAAVPSVTLNRVPPTPPAALTKTPADLAGLNAAPLSEAIVNIHRHLTGDTSPRAVVQQLALHGKATDTAYVRTTLSRAKTKAMEEATKEAARRAELQRSSGTGFYP